MAYRVQFAAGERAVTTYGYESTSGNRVVGADVSRAPAFDPPPEKPHGFEGLQRPGSLEAGAPPPGATRAAQSACDPSAIPQPDRPDRQS
jgi:hypothetical protein